MEVWETEAGAWQGDERRERAEKERDGGSSRKRGRGTKKVGIPEREKTRHKLTYKRRKGSNRAVKNMHILRLEKRGLDARQPVEKILYWVVSKKQTYAGAAALDNLRAGKETKKNSKK